MALSPQIKLALGVVLGFILISAAYGTPVKSSDSPSSQNLADQIALLQQQLTEIQNVIGQQQQQPNQIEQKTLQSAPIQQQNSQFMQNRPLRSAAWQPMKRLVAWQPMKRSEPIVNQDLQRDQLIRAIETQLSDVLHAGETLGISAEDVLTHLRQRSDVNFS